MTEREKQIEEMSWEICYIPRLDSYNSYKSCDDCNCYGKCHAMYYAKRAYEAGYRKQVEGEWIETVEHKTSLLKSSIRKEKIYCCPYCGRVYRKRMNYCGHCGAKMKGGAENEP